jgi:SAM-dependent methyltransferase
VLCTAATLLGLRPAPVDRCRVLELGCASGGNLIPMALTLPGSEFVGVDLSPAQIAAGEATLAALRQEGAAGPDDPPGPPGANVRLLAADLMTLGEDLGPFDYILCHGVYSWVPEPVRDQILRLCQRHLAPMGVAYISFNTYPGWHKRQPVRDMMRYHTAGMNPAEAVRQARALLEFLLAGVPDKDGTYHRMLRDEADKLRGTPDSYVFHEHLLDNSRPIYFHEFAAHAAAHGLAYLTEAEGRATLAELPEPVARALRPLASDPIRLEQYLDFVRNRMLRKSLLVREGVPIDRHPPPARVLDAGLSASALARPRQKDEEAPPDLRPGVSMSFASRVGVMSTDDPLTKAVLCALHRAWPLSLSVADLGQAAIELLGQPTPPQALAEVLHAGFFSGFINLHAPSLPTPFTLLPQERPIASPLARLQARDRDQVTSLRHQVVSLHPIDRVLLQALDGSADRRALHAFLCAAERRGVLQVAPPGGSRSRSGPGPSQEAIQAALLAQIEPALRRLALAPLLLS